MDSNSYNPNPYTSDDITNPYSQPSAPRAPQAPSGHLNDAPRQSSAGASARPSVESSPRRKRSEPKSPREWGIVKFFTDRRLAIVLGVALILVAAFMLVSVISFIRTAGTADQSLVTNLSLSEMGQNPDAVLNAGGAAGAKLSHMLLMDSLGLGSLVFIVYFVLLGLALLRLRACEFWSLTFKTLIIAITTSMVFGLITVGIDLHFPLGGYHGLYMNRLIIAHFQWIGAILVSIFLISVVVAIYFYDLLKIWNAYRARLRAFRAQRRQEEEDRRRKEEEAAEALRRNDPAAAPQPQTQPDVAAGRKVMGFETDDPIDARIDSPALPDPEPAPEDSAEPASVETEEITPDDQAPDTPADAPESQQSAEPQQPETSHEPQAPQEPETPQEPQGPAFQVNVTEEIEQADPDEFKPFDPTAELPRFAMPSIELFAEGKENSTRTDILEQEENKERIIRALNQFRISISHIEATVGPTVTLYEIIPSEGVKISTIQKLENDIALNLAAIGIRIIAPIPGKGTIGIEVPNKEPQSVAIRSILGSRKYQECNYELPIAMGATISNEVFIADLAAMPHLLVAGATGMGKSVGMNVIISSLIYKKHPAELKFVLIDPKMVEFYPYRLLERHFLAKLPDEEDPIVTDMEKVVPTLKSLCIEMDARYNLLKEAGVVKITQYNQLFIQRRLNPANGHRYMPYIVVIVDEYADLFMTAGKEVETPIARIAQKARAVGIHMIIATQRPSATVLTGIIKANFPGRIAFRVSQSIDSKVILDLTGANQLIGKGDMLFSHNGKLTRVQCAYIDNSEIKAVCESIDRQPGFEHAYYLPEYIPEGGDAGSGGNNNFGEKDPLFDEASRLVVSTGVASTSSLQRRYSIGYNRAGKIMDQMEAAGIVGPATGGKPRTVLVDSVTLESILNP